MKFSFISTVAQGIKKALCTAKHYIQLQYKLSEQKRQQQMQQYQQQYIQSQADIIQYELQEELYEVLSRCNYSFMNKIHLIEHIRPAGYVVKRQGIIYRFLLSANEAPPQCILDQLKQNINLDIYNCQKKLLYSMPFETAYCLHPHIIGGMQVLKVSAVGTDIQLYIVSTICP